MLKSKIVLGMIGGGILLSSLPIAGQLADIQNATQPKEIQQTVVEEKIKSEEVSSFIKLKEVVNPPVRESDNAFRLYGETSDNCSKITAEAYDGYGSLYDKHDLSLYKLGDTTFKYGIREDWNNLKAGTNTYKFKASCENEQEVETSLTIDFPLPPPSYESYSQDLYKSLGAGLSLKAVAPDYSSNYDTSSNDYYINTDGESVPSPVYSDTVPAGASAICRDGTYSFSRNRRGTCSHHGGVDQWL